ncbi:hypothetical protein H696_04350 [Fonticula alba]|uniref:General stress protein FMN-binding split barrel domain-containing protein n=1 Tax=Fonticula alba TaxID=691883 RepID=A0A058Z3V3_FONAL|nr:hypothetical protein H696_04350 [Fonticula alba]KCV68930.1 hypothetical protein H696_04350 [Fonticula alba]|eukprot:XP_009496501.1 hypothetical protein H696_04350 [Fonticula alba]
MGSVAPSSKDQSRMMDSAHGDKQHAEKVKKLVENMRGFHNAMLTTRRADSGLRTRPMAVAHVDDNGDVWFAMSCDSSKCSDIEFDPHVSVSFQSSSSFISISGKAIINKDRQKIDEFYTHAWDAFFPKGKESPELCLLRVEAQTAEIWDNTLTTKITMWMEAGMNMLKRGATDEAGPHSPKSARRGSLGETATDGTSSHKIHGAHEKINIK